MAEPIRYLSADDVEALHDFIMESTDTEPAPLRDRGLLEAALARPRMVGLYEGADLIRQAAILAVAISQSQAYVQGNKRTAFIAADVFLQDNGHVYDGDPLEMAYWLERIATVPAGERDGLTTEFEGWLREHVVEEPPDDEI